MEAACLYGRPSTIDDVTGDAVELHDYRKGFAKDTVSVQVSTVPSEPALHCCLVHLLKGLTDGRDLVNVPLVFALSLSQQTVQYAVRAPSAPCRPSLGNAYVCDLRVVSRCVKVRSGASPIETFVVAVGEQSPIVDRWVAIHFLAPQLSCVSTLI